MSDQVHPPKTDVPLHVDPNAVLASAVAPQRFQPIAAQRSQIAERLRTVQQRQTASRADGQTLEESPRRLIPEAPYHAPTVAGVTFTVKVNFSLRARTAERTALALMPGGRSGGRVIGADGERIFLRGTVTSRFLQRRPDTAKRFGNCFLRRMAAAVAQARLVATAGCQSALSARTFERSGNITGIPFGVM